MKSDEIKRDVKMDFYMKSAKNNFLAKAIDKGMPIEQLQQLLGHQRIDTTLQYAMVKQSNVKSAHRKYIG